MQSEGDRVLYATECSLLAVVAFGWALFFLVRRLQCSRPALAIGWPIGAAFAIRLGAIALLSASPSLRPLRGPDDRTFGQTAVELAQTPGFGIDGIGAVVGEFHVYSYALQLGILDSQDIFSVRIAQVGLAVVGIALIAAATYDLAGPRAAKIVCWFAALEPSNVFFSGLLHKEGLLILAEGMLALGAARMWLKRDWAAGALLVGGSGLAIGVRPYAGVMLAAAALLVTLHSALRRTGANGARAPQLAVGMAILALFGSGLMAASSQRILSAVQVSQDANTSDESNLKLERVDFSSIEGVALNLPQRIRDLLLRPYPWQVANASQRLGVVATLASWLLLIVLLTCIVTDLRGTLRRAPPLIYIALLLALGYALSVGNAGTGFRYRTHLVVLGAAVVAILVLGPSGWPARRGFPTRRRTA